MILGRVVGEVVATIKHGDLAGFKLLLVRAESAPGRSGRTLIALDVVDAGIGDRVLVNDEGNGAAQLLRRARGAVRSVVVGVVDEVDELDASARA